MSNPVTIARFHIHIDPACIGGTWKKTNRRGGNSNDNSNDDDDNECVIMYGNLPVLGGDNVNNAHILTRNSDNPYIWSSNPIELPFRRGTSVSTPNELFQIRFGIAKVTGRRAPQPITFLNSQALGHSNSNANTASNASASASANANAQQGHGNEPDTRRIEEVCFIEKGIPRDEKASRRNYFYAIQPDYLDSRFSGYFQRNEYYSYFTDFTVLVLNLVKSNMITPSEFLDIYNDIVESASFATRTRAEDAIDAVMTSYSADQHIPDDIKMCIMAIIGAFGKSSSDQTVRTGNTNSYGYNNNSNYYYRSIPQPKPWCWKFIAELDILRYFTQPMEGIFGRLYRWCLIGLAEACERISEHFFEVDWLRVFPLLDHHDIRASVSIPGDKDESIKAFLQTSEELLQASRSLLERAIVEEEKMGIALAEKNAAAAAAAATAATGASASASTPNNEQAPAPKPKLISPARRVANAWLRVIIRFSPTTTSLSQCLSKIVSLDDTIGGSLKELIKAAFGDRLRSMKLNTEKKLSGIYVLLKSLPASLAGATIAAAILKNDTIDIIAAAPSSGNPGFSTLLDIINLCTDNMNLTIAASADNISRSLTPVQQASSGLSVEKSSETIDAALHAQQALESEQHFEIESAAKEYLRRNHGSSKLLEKDNDKDGWGGSNSNWPWYSAGLGNNAGYGYGSQSRRPPTKEELAKDRLEALDLGISTVNALLQSTKFFSSKSNGLLFELSRCHFFKGSDELALKAITAFYSGSQFAGLHPSLIDFLEDTSCKLARSVAGDEWAKSANASSSERAANIKTVLDLVLSTTPSSSKYVKDMIFAISLEISSPPYSLASVVSSAPFWIELISVPPVQRELTSIASKIGNTPIMGNDAALANLLSSYHQLFAAILQVRDVMEQAKMDLDSGKLRLQELGILIQGNSFINLADRLASISLQLKSLKNEQITAARKKRDSFRLALDQLLCYVALFCNCGVAIDSRNLRTRTTALSTGYNDLQLGKLDSILEEFESALAAAPWLFSLRNSTLFLEMWRDIGSAMLAKEQARLAERHNNAGHASPSTAGNNSATAASSSVEATPDVAVLTQKMVLRGMVPEARKRWSELKSSIKSGSVPVAVLEKTFGRLPNPQICYQELRILAKTAQAEDEKEMIDESVEQEWLRVAATRTFDFFLLVKLRRAAPALVKLREVIGPICTTQITPSTASASATTENNTNNNAEEVANTATAATATPSASTNDTNHGDDLYGKLVLFNEEVKNKWDTQLFKDVNDLLVMIRNEFYTIPVSQFDFLTIFAESSSLVEWLLAHDSTDEFNRLLQVCRPCVLGQDRLLSAMASLVYIRTSLIQLLFVRPRSSKYSGLKAFIEVFVDTTISEFPQQQIQGEGQVAIPTGAVEDALWHLRNVVSSFDALHDVFEKQTKSEGIKSCLDLRDIFRSGEFVLVPSPILSSVLFLEIKDGEAGAFTVGANDTAAVAATLKSSTRKETEEYLHDLRSKLLMIEIPDEMQDQMGAPPNEMVSAFVSQLEVLCQLRDALHSLCISGHPKFLSRKGSGNEGQSALSYRFPFRLDGMSMMKESVSEIKNKISQWKSTVKKARDEFHALNAYTMRDIIQISDLLMEYHKTTTKVESEISSTSKNPVPTPVEEEIKVLPAPTATTTALPSFDSGVSCLACTFYNANPTRTCSVCGTPLPLRATANNATAGSASTNDAPKLLRSISTIEESLKNEYVDNILIHDLVSLLRLCCWDPENVIRDSVKKWSANLLNSTEKIQSQSDEERLLTSVGEFLASLVGVTKKSSDETTRSISAPSSKVQNQSDMLVTFEKSIPLWVTYAKSPLHTIDVALSIYLRRRRLPERGELLYCSEKTTMEDIEIFYRRFLCNRNNPKSASLIPDGRENLHFQSIPPVNDPVYCVVGVENLSYTFQVEMVDKLREMLKEYGTQRASSLVFISGLPNQVSLQLLSDHFTEIPSLPDAELRRALREAVDKHVGHTLSVFSHINGAGKSRYIMKHVALVDGLYYRIPIRESTTEASLVAALLRAANMHSILTNANPDLQIPAVFHIDVGHVVPYDVNILLFQLCIVGSLRDSLSSKVYNRERYHHIMIEIPNSKGEKTRSALRFATLLPTECCKVDPQSFELEKPQFVDETCTQIRMVRDEDTILVCTFLDAQERQIFLPGSEEYNIDWDMMTETQIMGTESERCYEILLSATCNIAPQHRAQRTRTPQRRRGSDDNEDDDGNGEDENEDENEDEQEEEEEENEEEEEEENEEDRNDRRNRIIAAATAATAAATAAAHAGNQEGGRSTVPSYQLFSNFVKFLAEQCRQANTYPLLQQQLLANLPGLEYFKDAFTRLLIETSKDFSLRSVPRPKHMHPTDETIPRLVHEADMARSEELKITGSEPTSKLLELPIPPVPQLIRERSIDMAVRFSRMVTWESCDHPFVLFYRTSIFSDVEGLDVISLRREFTTEYIGRNLEEALVAQGIDLRKNWAEMTSRQGIEILQRVEGLFSRTQRVIAPPEIEPTYVLTVDNMLKMLSILLRLKYRIPCIIMGETGCGKSSLIRELCAIIGIGLRVLNIHGGTTDAEVLNWLKEKVAEVKAAGVGNSDFPQVILFLDEINTSNILGLAKELCEGFMDGQPIPNCVQLIFACNPYRLRKKTRTLKLIRRRRKRIAGHSAKSLAV